MNDEKEAKDPTIRLVEAVEHIANLLQYITEQGVFVKIDEDISEN